MKKMNIKIWDGNGQKMKMVNVYGKKMVNLEIIIIV